MGSASQIDLFNTSSHALLERWGPVLDKASRVFSWKSGLELAWLCELASRYNGTFIEVGSYVGKSALCQLLASPGIKVVSLDKWDDEGSFDEYQFNLRHAYEQARVRAISGPSHDGLDLLMKEGHAGRYDYAFIDGGHLYDDVRGDIAKALPLLKPGAIICGHDYRPNLQEDGVTKSVRELLPNHKNVLESIWACQL